MDGPLLGSEFVSDARVATEPRLAVGVLAGGASVELIGSAIACVLAIAGLRGYAPSRMAALTASVLGIALAAHGASMIARWDTIRRNLDRNRYERVGVAIAIGVETLAGATSAVLGALVSRGALPVDVLPIAAIVVGAALPFGGAAQPQLTEVAVYRDTKLQRLANRTIVSSGGSSVLAGLGAVMLGILGVLDIAPAVTMSLVGYLGISAATMFAGGALTSRFVGTGTHPVRPMNHRHPVHQVRDQ
jgi:hypothetical protein